MPKLSSRFVTPDKLKAIQPERLVELLGPHLPPGISVLADAERIDHDALSLLLMSGSDELRDAVELVCVVQELSRPQFYDRLLAAAQQAGLDIEERATGPDLIARLLLHNPRLVSDLRTEIASLLPKRIERYMATGRRIPRPLPNKAWHKDLEDALALDFRDRQRGGGVRAHFFPEKTGFRLMIRRGDTPRAQSVIDEKDESKTRHMVARPELYDVVRYDKRHGDLLVNATTKGDTRSYCRNVGRYVFNNDALFDPDDAPRRYSLDPIRDGESCVAVGSIEGLVGARLEVLRLEHPRHDHVHVTLGPDNAFTALKLVGGSIDAEAQITRAVFKLQLRGSQREHSLVIAPPITAVHERDDVGEVVEQFVEARGYLLSRSESQLGATNSLFSMP